MHFGNWDISGESITWKGNELQRFVIPLTRLNEQRVLTGGSVRYEWILLATDEDWLTENDLYDLNYAFVYAMGKSGLGFDYEIFDATLAEQYEHFESEENEDAEL